MLGLRHQLFPGRFTTIEPAAVDIHATYSGFADEVCALHLAPDCEAAQRVGDGTPISTRRVAMCAHLILQELVRALLRPVGLLRVLRRGLAYLLANARRTNVPREYRSGRLRPGLATVGAP